MMLRFCLPALAVFFLLIANGAVHAASDDETWRLAKCYAATKSRDSAKLRAAVGHCDIVLATDQLSDQVRARTYNNRCWILLTLNMPTQLALDDCTRAIQLRPSLAEAYVNRSRGLIKKKLYDAAEADIYKALDLAPNSSAALINLGALHLRMEKLEAAMQALDRAFALNPQSPEAYNNRGALYLKTGIFKEALNDFDMALAMQPDFAPAMFNRGVVLLRQAKFAEARRAFSGAIRFGGQDGRAFLFRGFAHEALGDKVRSEKDFRRAKALGIDSRWLSRKLPQTS